MSGQWDTDAAEGRKPRAPMIHREHFLQEQALAFANAAIDLPRHAFRFMAFDRSQATGEFSFQREMARGHVPGTFDNLTVLPAEYASPWVEFKWPGNHPSDPQMDMWWFLNSIGHWAFFAWTIDHYRLALAASGVPLRPGAAVMAMQYQAKAEANIARAEQRAGIGGHGAPAKKRASSKARKTPPSPAVLRVAARWRAKGLF